MTTNLYVDIHLLQDVPPANLNRDDTGSPKSARYGGVDRLRVSSQTWKRATRLDFADRMGDAPLGVRTRRVHETVTDGLVAGGVPEEHAGPITTKLLEQIGIKASKKKDAETSYLLFFSRPQVARIAHLVLEHENLWAEPEQLSKQIDVKAVLGHGHSLDVALFGRMVADLPEINVDAACQVSHALATHAAPNQFDYFTAVDDAQTAGESGAGMIGTVEFNSATMYRYATVNVRELISNMDEEAGAFAGLETFLRSFTLSMPTGKQNTFASHTRPGLVWFVVRGDQPVNYMSAFERPVRAGSQGFLERSIETLAEFVNDESSRWGDQPAAKAASYLALTEAQQAESAFGPRLSFDEAVSATVDAARDLVGHG